MIFSRIDDEVFEVMSVSELVSQLDRARLSLFVRLSWLQDDVSYREILEFVWNSDADQKLTHICGQEFLLNEQVIEEAFGLSEERE